MSQARIENNTIIGTVQEIYKCLTEEYHIRPEKPEKKFSQPTFFQLTPLPHQIETIHNTPAHNGEIYYTREWGGENGTPYSFEILHVKIQIID